MSLARFATLALAFAVCPCVLAQYTAAKIVFKDPGPYSQADLEAVAQLHPHDKVGHDTVQAAAQRLIDTGYFDDVGASMEGSASALQVTFKLKPYTPAQMTTASFENFVWLTPQERDAAIHKAAPLFAGMLPSAGTQTDAITAALQAALAAKGVQATVVHTDIEPSLLQPERIISLSVDRPAVLIHAVSLRGVAADLAAQIQTVAGKLRNGAYTEGKARPTTEDRLLTPYFDAGYIAAKLDDFGRVVAVPTGSSVGVDVSGIVSAGDVYHVSALDYAGTPIASADLMRKSAKLHVGDVASRKLLLETLQPIDDAYRHLGYMDVFVDSGAKIDTTAHTVSYSVTVMPGEQYRLHSVVANGLPPDAQTEFDRVWRMKAGELYDVSYVNGFFKSNSSLHALQGYGCAYRASADPQTHLVDLTLNCGQLKVR